MTVPAAYAKVKEKQRQEEAVETARCNRIHAEHTAEEMELYKNISKALRPYNGSTLEGHKVTVTFKPKDKSALFFVDGNHWLTLQPERNYYSAHDSDGVPTGEGSTWVTLRVIQHGASESQGSKFPNEYYCYFPAGKEGLTDPERFATSIQKMMSDYKYSKWSKS